MRWISSRSYFVHSSQSLVLEYTQGCPKFSAARLNLILSLIGNRNSISENFINDTSVRPCHRHLQTLAVTSPDERMPRRWAQRRSSPPIICLLTISELWAALSWHISDRCLRSTFAIPWSCSALLPSTIPYVSCQWSSFVEYSLLRRLLIPLYAQERRRYTKRWRHLF